MSSYNLVIAVPTADRASAYAFARALGLETPGDLAEDGVPEPLRVQLNQHACVMYVPTGGFGWITEGRATAEPGTSECLLSLQLGTSTEVDSLLGRVEAAGGRVASGPEQKAWGYTGTFTDPDGHLWEAIVSAI
jgi:predicted lactoylglutathione lyase